jgi:hypothetical protein
MKWLENGMNEKECYLPAQPQQLALFRSPLTPDGKQK